MEPKRRRKRSVSVLDTLPDWLLMLADNQLLVAGAIFATTAAIIALCVPGLLLPIAASSGALMNAWTATGIVTLGAVAGSMVIFLTTRHVAQNRIPARLAGYLETFEAKFRARGAWFVFGLRLVGTPHFLVSGASALVPIRASSFALATLAGLLPTIMMAALAGSAI